MAASSPADDCRARMSDEAGKIAEDYEANLRVLAAFEREGVRYAVVGAAALNMR